MAKIRLRYVNAFVNKNRKSLRARYYFRRPGVRAIPLPGIPGSDEFMAAYGAALATMRQWELAPAARLRAPLVLS